MAKREFEMTEEIQNPVNGRQALIEAYRSMNPETGDELDDELLFEFSNNRYADIEGRYNKLNGANNRLAELVSDNPQLGAFLSLIVGENPRSIPYALTRVFGKEAFELDNDGLADFENGNSEYLAQVKASRAEQEQAQENFKQYEINLMRYVQENGLNPTQLDEIHSGVMEIAEGMLMGTIPTEIIDLVYKGLNYDRDVQEAADTGLVEGLNQRVDKARLKRHTANDAMPDLHAATGAGEADNRPVKKRTSFYDEIKEA